MKANKYTYIIIITVISIFFNLIILIFPEIIINSVKQGLLLWYSSAVPSLLPFIISINMLKRTSAPLYISKILEPVTKKIFKISGTAVFPILMGMLSGYPLGAKLSCELYMDKKISKREAKHLILFTNNSGPLFITGTLGTIFLGNTKTGWIILIIHYISAIFIGIITAEGNVCKKNIVIKTPCMSLSEIITQTIEDSMETIVLIGGYIILFSMITSIIIPHFNNGLSKGIVYSIFEMTGACNLLSKQGAPGIALCAAAVSWGGLSVHAQSAGYISKAGLSVKSYITAKFMQSFIAFILCILTLHFLQ